MLEGSDLLIEQNGYLFSSIFIFRGGVSAHIVRTLLGGGYLKRVQKRTRGGVRGFKIAEFRAYVLFEWPPGQIGLSFTMDFI